MIEKLMFIQRHKLEQDGKIILVGSELIEGTYAEAIVTANEVIIGLYPKPGTIEHKSVQLETHVYSVVRKESNKTIVEDAEGFRYRFAYTDDPQYPDVTLYLDNAESMNNEKARKKILEGITKRIKTD